MPTRPKPKADAWADLVRLLRERPRSIFEVRDRLGRRGHGQEAIDDAVASAVDAGLLDDRAFAKLWVSDRLWHHPLSRAAVAQELRQKGVASAVIDASLDELYPPVRELEVARELACSRYERLRGVDAARRASRTVRFLERRGFRRGTALEIVRALEAGANDG